MPIVDQDYSGAQRFVSSVVRPTVRPTAEPSRAIDEVQDQIRQVSQLSRDNARRIEQIANRLGYYPPKQDSGKDTAQTPANGSLDAVRSLVAEVHNVQSDMVDYLVAIERQV